MSFLRLYRDSKYLLNVFAIPWGSSILPLEVGCKIYGILALVRMPRRHIAIRLPTLLLVEYEMAFSLHCVFSKELSSGDLSSCLRARSFNLRVWEGDNLLRDSLESICDTTSSICCVLLFFSRDPNCINTHLINALCAIHKVVALSTEPTLCKK